MDFENFLIDIILPILFIVLVIVAFSNFINNLQKQSEQKIELIKNTKEYQVYDNCHSLDDKYYCYNLEEVED